MKEIWKDVVGYEGLYKASNLGRVKSLPKKILQFYTKEKILCNKVNRKNIKKHYYYVGLLKNGIRKNLMIHRLVAQSFIKNKFNCKTVNHKDGDKLNNNVSNLEWMSLSDNHKHAFSIGLRDNHGNNHPGRKLFEKDIKYIRGSSLSNQKLGEMFNVTRQCVLRVKKKLTWKNI